MRVTFIRHGASEWTGQPILCGHADIPLSSVGVAQANALAAHLRGRQFAALWSSPLQRAQQTAACVAHAIGHVVVTDPRLMEMDLGTLDGQRFDQLPRGPKTFRDRWQRDPVRVRFPRGENLSDVSKRTWQVLGELYDRHPQDHVVVVSHLFAIQTLLCRALSIPLKQFRTFNIDTAAITTVQMDKSGFRLLLLNDGRHLDEISAAHSLRAPSLPPR